MSAQKVQQAKDILKKLADKRAVLMQDEKATAAYWNADDWGSISGVRDAAEWVENELANYLLTLVNPKKPKDI